MTAIVYRDGVMAADSVCMNYDVKEACVPKITRKPDGTLIGVSGREGPARWSAEAWPDLDRAKAPPLVDGSFYALIVSPDGTVQSCDHHLVPFPLIGPFHVLGKSGQFLLGALHAGASAEAAIQLAILYTDSVGGPIQVERIG